MQHNFDLMQAVIVIILISSSLFLFISESSGFEIEPYPLTEMLGEAASETALQYHPQQVASVMSNIPYQASPPVGDELAKNVDNLQVTILAFVFFILIVPQAPINNQLLLTPLLPHFLVSQFWPVTELKVSLATTGFCTGLILFNYINSLCCGTPGRNWQS